MSGGRRLDDEDPIHRSSNGFELPPFVDSARLRTRGAPVEDAHFPPPGQFPFTRGFDEEGYRGEPWGMEMYAGFSDPEQANRRYKLLLDNGATGGVSIALDLPTQIGYDSDHMMSAGEVGRSGVALDSYRDVERLLSGVDLARAGHMFSTANCIAPIFYAWILVFCRRNGVDPSTFVLQIQNDPIKEYVARGTQFLPIEAAVKLAGDVVLYSAEHTPSWLPISVSGSHMKQAGASPALEAAFTVANAVTYMADVQRRGLSIAQFNPTLELHFCTEMNFFDEVAKYRAVRRAWSEIAHERFGVPHDRLRFRLHAATSGAPLTKQQPTNNIARITMQLLAQVLGGVDAGRTASWDEALAIPTESSAITSLRINQIVAHETGVRNVVDPLGGSYYVEELTQQTYDVIMAEVEKIGEMGGSLAAVHNGYIVGRLTEGAYRQQLDIDSGESIIVGVNAYQQAEDTPPPRFRSDEEAEQRKIAQLDSVRAERSQVEVDAALAHLAEVCAGGDNVMEAVIAAVEVEATVGEISDVWRAAYGAYAAQTMYF